MSNQTITFPQFPNHSIYISLFKGLSSNSIKQIKQELVSGNKAYDYCFLNTKHIVSLEHLYSSIHRSILNYTNNNMAAKTLNTEIIFNLSPINNIVDALKNFGIREDCPNVIIIKVLPTEECTEDKILEITENLSALLGEGVEKASLDDELMPAGNQNLQQSALCRSASQSAKNFSCSYAAVYLKLRQSGIPEKYLTKPLPDSGSAALSDQLSGTGHRKYNPILPDR